MFEAIVAILVLIRGLALLAFSSDKAVHHSMSIASALGASPLMIGLVLVSLGTDLPEVVVDLTAIRKQQYELAIGDVIGSCIFDACVSIRIGPLIFPIKVSGDIAAITGSYVIIVSIVVILALALRKKLTGCWEPSLSFYTCFHIQR
ncbi:MAG: hypothetical protein OEX76_00380 [Candidatus Bathyarchaeota archaeon]|nr:hypothetical protein [Candidatus Bathyarchaeota archaeon]MDH5531958.1 hypothetical protein [Candidatus Bathyarchaeota archaeon]MDH5712614.1 hypothetical protein [Candidatus Bathyarchaeota archaeon]